MTSHLSTQKAYFSAQDHEMMVLALQQARKGEYTTSPNPNVGCVIVDKKNNIVGMGFHVKAGGPHAEIHALNMAKGKALGSTAYVTLEPCSHTGRTGPCATALVNAQVSRVVIATLDKNPKVTGEGVRLLQQAGIQVDIGLLAADAERLNTDFNKRMQRKMPYVTVKLAASLDGKTALVNGLSQWISSPPSRADVQLHRARSCAILTSASTIIADNPNMNVRLDSINADHCLHVLLKDQDLDLRQPVIVVIDSKNRLKAEAKIFNNNSPVWIFNAYENTQLRKDLTNVKQFQVPFNHCQAASAEYLDLSQIMTILGEQEINNVWVEAGKSLSGALISEKLADELILYQAPILMGASARGLIDIGDVMEMDHVLKVSFKDVQTVGDDIKLTLSLSS